MAGWRQAVELAMSREELEILTTVSRSRTELASRVSRAQMLLAYRDHPSFCAVGKKLGVHHQTVQRCAERALAYGPLAALDDRPRPGKEPTITPEAKAWLADLFAAFVADPFGIARASLVTARQDGQSPVRMSGPSQENARCDGFSPQVNCWMGLSRWPPRGHRSCRPGGSGLHPPG